MIVVGSDAGLADVEAERVHTADEVKKMVGVKNVKKREYTTRATFNLKSIKAFI